MRDPCHRGTSLAFRLRCVLLMAAMLAVGATCPEQTPRIRPTEWAQPAASTTLGNCFRVSAELLRSDQPHAADLAALQTLGVKSLLSLRHDRVDDEIFARSGLVLIREAMRAQDVSVAQLVAALRKFRSAPKPVLVHCWRGSDRTGFFVAGYRIICQGWSREAALEELQRGGFGFHAFWYPNIVRCLAGLDVEEVRRQVLAPANGAVTNPPARQPGPDGAGPSRP